MLGLAYRWRVDKVTSRKWEADKDCKVSIVRLWSGRHGGSALQMLCGAQLDGWRVELQQAHRTSTVWNEGSDESSLAIFII